MCSTVRVCSFLRYTFRLVCNLLKEMKKINCFEFRIQKISPDNTEHLQMLFSEMYILKIPGGRGSRRN